MGGDRLGEASGQADSEVIYYSYTIFDEESGNVLSFLMICGCGLPAILFNEEETFFYCEHCDRPCAIKDCDWCKEHYAFSAEKSRQEYLGDLDAEDSED